MSKKKFATMTGKGYYIALILCAAGIGISGYLYYHNDTSEPAAQEDPTPVVQEQDVTQPGGVEAVAKEPRVPQTENKPTMLKTAAPVAGDTVGEYAVDCLSYNRTTRDWRTHNGIDLAAEAGTKVTAAADGTVYAIRKDDTMGMTVVLRHAGEYMTTYASLAEPVTVEAGETVKLGQQIGTVGTTAILETALGDHVHFSVSCQGEPVNPEEFLSMK